MTEPLPPANILYNSSTGQPELYYNPYSGTYTRSRSYGLRMQRGYARGTGRQEARGHAPAPGTTERQERALKFQNKYGIPLQVWERWRSKYINYLNELSPDAPITIAMVAEIKQLYDQGYRDPQLPATDWKAWVEVRLSERLDDTIYYQEYQQPLPGRMHYQSRSGVWYQNMAAMYAATTAPPIEWWYYH